MPKSTPLCASTAISLRAPPRCRHPIVQFLSIACAFDYPKAPGWGVSHHGIKHRPKVKDTRLTDHSTRAIAFRIWKTANKGEQCTAAYKSAFETQRKMTIRSHVSRNARVASRAERLALEMLCTLVIFFIQRLSRRRCEPRGYGLPFSRPLRKQRSGLEDLASALQIFELSCAF